MLCKLISWSPLRLTLSSAADLPKLSIFSKPLVKYLCKYTILLYPLDLYWFVYYYMYMFKYLFRRHPMLSLTVYCKDHKRRPIRLGYRSFFRDLQADIPTAWCSVCGSEIFEADTDRCTRCRHTKGENR